MFRYSRDPRFYPPPPPEPKKQTFVLNGNLQPLPPPMTKPPMVKPPMQYRALAFRDIGKSIGDLLGKDYPINGIKLEAKSITSNGVFFLANGFRDAKTGAISGEMKTKYHDKTNGITYTESWSSNNVLSSTIELFNTLSPGLKLEFNGSYNPSNGNKGTKVTAEYRKNGIFSRCNVDLFKGPIVNSDFCINQRGLLIGAETAYNLRDSKLIRYNLGVGYNAPGYSLALQAFEGLNTYSASYFHRVNPQIEAGTKATWNKNKAGPVNVEFGTRYILNRDAFVKAKIDMNGRLGLGFVQNLNNGIRVSVGGSFDTKRMNENVHKVGMNISFNQ
ncbi:hypothetical protein LY90DRAFT_502972 [Neocallimastix californiae]|jgi:voltage-dependent anion channel protein 2|uniref:Voltage-dependent ion-selective channel n=1 Tax=Neocallimastix californiae TaxID=1754190 RepID=A0A1Y2ESF6_9FUNG|nr:hypothetical protein LY90DRAFT_502972 [Neocallimastix californiae]|eukprot:ORY73785.1 hypothetical protein LY90DRAFT_502972 [Neocallimastix californiae]